MVIVLSNGKETVVNGSSVVIGDDMMDGFQIKCQDVVHGPHHTEDIEHTELIYPYCK